MTTLNRRAFLKAMGISGVAVTQATALQEVLAHAVSQGGFVPTSATERDPITHVINRLTFGPTDHLIRNVQEIGVSAFIEAQLNPENIDDSEFDATYGEVFPLLNEPSSELMITEFEMRQQENNRNGVAQNLMRQLIGNWIYRSLASERQLHEIMAQFWANHFSIHTDSIPDIFLRLDDERNVTRANPFGKFRDILYASAKSPAMLTYLDNATSRKEAPNENYARELMELHTLGVNGGYTEDDVKAVARAFTGWSVTRLRFGANRANENTEEPGQFYFNPEMHDTEEKVVLGHVIPAGGGIKDGEMVLDILASHPSTAQFISTKLVRRFVSDDPPATLVERTAQTYLATDGDIRSMLWTIFTSDEFWNATPKFKQPFEFIISSLRAMNYAPSRFESFARWLQPILINMGHIPFGRPSPDGYPDVGTYWMSNLLTRWNVAIDIAHGMVNGAQSSFRTLLEANNVGSDAPSILNFVGQLLYGRPLNTIEMDTINAYLSAEGTTTETLQDMIALMLAAPAFQYR